MCLFLKIYWNKASYIIMYSTNSKLSYRPDFESNYYTVYTGDTWVECEY